MQEITEETVRIKASVPKKDVHAKMDVFYNPQMRSNRNISILLLNALERKNLKLCLPLAGSGIRALRFLKELSQDKIKQIVLNDKKENFKDLFKENLRLNNITKNKSLSIHNDDANHFLQEQDGFDYIDLDPFGSPNPFLATAIASISRGGILAVTATDTAALTGTYPKVTRRKYWAENHKNYLMHETGLRILIRKVQLQGVQFDKALTPILAYHKDHYFRVYFKAEKGKQKCDTLIKQHQYLVFNTGTGEFKTSDYNKEKNFNLFIGPLWTGQLQEKTLLQKMTDNNQFKEEQKFLSLLLQEKDLVGFYDLHAIAKIHSKMPPKMELALAKLDATRTHFSPDAIKTEKSYAHITSTLQEK